MYKYFTAQPTVGLSRWQKSHINMLWRHRRRECQRVVTLSDQGTSLLLRQLKYNDHKATMTITSVAACRWRMTQHGATTDHWHFSRNRTNSALSCMRIVTTAQSVRPYSLSRVFAWCSLVVNDQTILFCRLKRLWSESLNTQANLGRRGAAVWCIFYSAIAHFTII